MSTNTISVRHFLKNEFFEVTSNCAQSSLLTLCLGITPSGLKPHETPGMNEPVLAMNKANALPTILSLQHCEIKCKPR